ncbi:TPA: hypothetical protein DCP77_03470 [Candidatus Collierbacteria bacterium]|nr:hypothetical protein [Candidatus Collierbacteria bacterium]
MITYRELTDKSHRLETDIAHMLRIDFTGTRYKVYQGIVEDITVAWENQTTAEYIKRHPFNETVFSMQQLQELVSILGFVKKIFACSSPKVQTHIRKKVKVMLGGPIFTHEENFNSSEARNTQFELRVATKMSESGYKAELLDHPDVLVDTKPRVYGIECKRVNSSKAIMSNIARAISQLDEYSGSYDGRIVAVDISRLLDLGKKYFSSPTPERANEAILDVLHDTINKIYTQMDSLSTLSINKRVVALMLTYSGLYILHDNSMGWVQEIGFLVFNKEHPVEAELCIKDFKSLKHP